MFHLPKPDRRTKLMIIYDKAVQSRSENSSVPVRKEGVDLKEYPAFAKRSSRPFFATFAVKMYLLKPKRNPSQFSSRLQQPFSANFALKRSWLFAKENSIRTPHRI